MGHYTTFIGSFALKRETPKEVIGALFNMTGAPDPETIEPLPECFKDCGRAHRMFRQNNELPGAAYCNFIREFDQYYLSFRCNFKNYDREIEIFMEWIRPWIESTSLVAQKITEDCYFTFYSITDNQTLEIRRFNFDEKFD